MKTITRVLVVAVLMAGIGSTAWVANAIAQEVAPGAAAPRVGDDEAGRLPPGYTVVVTKEQRTRIYSIQDSYQKQLDDLKKQIAAIESKREQEIAGLLDAEQKTILAFVLKVRERDRKKELPDPSVGN